MTGEKLMCTYRLYNKNNKARGTLILTEADPGKLNTHKIITHLGKPGKNNFIRSKSFLQFQVDNKGNVIKR
tara:strand:- start:1410 stop:1622 length:213 start_codon:yes stop_codon:yes gene_type:complete